MRKIALMLAIGAATAFGVVGAADAQLNQNRPSLPDGPARTDAPRADERAFDEASWRAYADGKTLYYALPSGPVGREYFAPDSNEVLFQFYDGRSYGGQCFEGTWSEANGVFCFDYDQRYCFFHVERDGAVYARAVDGEEQVVTEVTDEIFTCRGQIISRAPGATMTR